LDREHLNARSPERLNARTPERLNARSEATMEIDCSGKETREINRQIKAWSAVDEAEIVLRNPAARHNLAVGLLQPCRMRIDGSVGYYCVGLSDGPDVEIRGSAGWGLAENLMSGRVVLHGNAGNSAAASIRGGLVVVHGDAGARAGIAMKGGALVVGGDAGYMVGFMLQKGDIIICGSAGDALGDSMYEGRIFVGGEIASLGNDAVLEELTPEDRSFLEATLGRAGLNQQGVECGVSGVESDVRSRHPTPHTPHPDFKKVVSGKQLYNFDRRDFERWRHAL
jgi:glutamate synthase domain-containing protein 3